MTRYNTRLLVITRSVTSEFENLSSQVLENGGEVHGGTSTNTLSIVALLQQTMDTTNGELHYERQGQVRLQFELLTIR